MSNAAQHTISSGNFQDRPAVEVTAHLLSALGNALFALGVAAVLAFVLGA